MSLKKVTLDLCNFFRIVCAEKESSSEQRLDLDTYVGEQHGHCHDNVDQDIHGGDIFDNNNLQHYRWIILIIAGSPGE